MMPRLPADAALPGLPSALDESTMDRLLRTSLTGDAPDQLKLEACRPEYVRYKPGTSCLIAYRLRVRLGGDDVQDLPAHVRLFAGDGARRAYERPSFQRLLHRAHRRHPGPPALRAAMLHEIGGLFQIYPVDPDLPQLARVSARPKMGRLLGELLGQQDRLRLRVQMIRYLPGRKALLRYDLRGDDRRSFYGKCYAGPRALDQHRLSQALAAAGLPVAPVLGTIRELEMVVHAAVDGRPLLELRDTAQYGSTLRHVAQVLSDLHRARIEGLTSVSADYEAGLVQRSAETLAVLLPEYGEWIRDLARGIAAELAIIPEQRATIHGDFYDDQILVNNGVVTLLDFDEARLGHPLVDVGNFLAHVSAKLSDVDAAEAARETFRDEYLARSGGDARSVAVFEASAVMQLAVGPFRRLEPDWPSAVLRLLRLADRRLQESAVAKSVPVGSAFALAHPLDESRVVRLLADAYGAAVEIERSDLVRHKEGRRSVLRHELRIRRDGGSDLAVVYAKVFASRRSQAVHATSLALWTVLAAENGRPRLPRPLAVLPEQHTVLHDELPGLPVIDRLLAGDVELAAAVAHSLHALHACGAQLTRRHGLDRELAPLAERVEHVASAKPEMAALAKRCLALTQLVGEQPWTWRWLPIHRDFYPQQVLVDGDQIGFLDLDDAAASEPAVDVANFLAHLHLERLRKPDAARALAASASSFLAAYRQRDPGLDPALLGFLEGTTLLRLAHIHPRFATPLLEESERCLLTRVP